MPNYFRAALFVAAVTLLGGCCRDTIREMGSIKDVAPRAPQRAAHAPSERTSQSAKVEREDKDDEIETGSIRKQPDCQGQHIAYQATKEYLKNFGPKPPDLPGERGPCKAEAQ